MDHRTARDSRLVYALPPGTPYTPAAILDFGVRALELDDRAGPGGEPVDTGEPGPAVTALEVVDSLVFSPGPDDRFMADSGPVTHGDVTQLWRARMDPTPDARPSFGRSGPAPATRSTGRFPPPTGSGSSPQPPSTRPSRWSGSALADHPGSVPRPVRRVDRSAGRLPHRTVAGRDIHVEVVERGFLAPFGVRATITTVTERQLRTDEHGGLTAILVQDDHLAVSGSPVTYPAPHMPHRGRAVPFPVITAVDPGSGPVERTAVVPPTARPSIRRRSAGSAGTARRSS